MLPRIGLFSVTALRWRRYTQSCGRWKRRVEVPFRDLVVEQLYFVPLEGSVLLEMRAVPR